MIAFQCSECGKTFRVPDQFAGRSARCKICGNTVRVPAAAADPEPALVSIGAADVEPMPVAPPPPPVMISSEPEAVPSPAEPLAAEVTTPAEPDPVTPAAEPAPVAPPERKVPMRTRRLRADAAAMAAAFADFDAITVEPLAGDPPEAYRVRFAVDSLQRGADGQPVPRRDHTAEIQLTGDYPRLAPKVKLTTPVFHPNIDPASVCVGDHWTAGERLVDLVIRIGEMLGYQAYNIQSPLDGEAAMWADLHRDQLPTDPRIMRPASWE